MEPPPAEAGCWEGNYNGIRLQNSTAGMPPLPQWLVKLCHCLNWSSGNGNGMTKMRRTLQMLSQSPQTSREKKNRLGIQLTWYCGRGSRLKTWAEHQHPDSTQLARWQGENTWTSSACDPHGGTIIGFEDRFEVKPTSVAEWLGQLPFVFSASALSPGMGQTQCHTQYITVLLLLTSMSAFDFTQNMGLKPRAWAVTSSLDIHDFTHSSKMLGLSSMCQIPLCTQATLGKKDERGYHPWTAYRPATNKQITWCLRRPSTCLVLRPFNAAPHVVVRPSQP